MEKRKWKDNPSYKEDDLLSRIAETVNDRPSSITRDYASCLTISGDPVSLKETPFKITEVSLSPSRLIPSEGEIYEEEKEKLKESVKSALKKFRESRLEGLDMLYSPFSEVREVLGEIDDKDEDPDERIERAKKKLADMGFSEEHVNSVCFLPKEKALKFATDELSLFLRPILEDFDYLFGKLSSFDPKERKKAFITVIRAWEEAAEEWEKEEKEHLHELSPGLLARLSRYDITFAQQMKNIANSSFRSMTDFDTALGAILISGMFPPASLLFVLPMLVPGLLGILFEDISKSRESKSRDQQALISEEMSRLFASKATGNAVMTEIALMLANGESPERVLDDMSKMKDRLRDMFEMAYKSGKSIFSSYSHNDIIQPGGAEHIKLNEETRDVAKAVLHEFWDERKEKALASIEESAITESEIAKSAKICWDQEKVFCRFDKSPEENAFSKLKFRQVEKNIKEYSDHINKIINEVRYGSGAGKLVLSYFGILSPATRIAAVFSSDYGIFEEKIGRQSGTSMAEARLILSVFKDLEPLKDLRDSEVVKTIAADAVVRMLPQELLGKIHNISIPDISSHRDPRDLIKAMYPIEKMIANIKNVFEDAPEDTRKMAGLIMFLAGFHDYEEIYPVVKELLVSKDEQGNFPEIVNLKAEAEMFLRKMKQMDERKFDDLVTDFYVAFNHTAAEPGLVEAVKNHELPFEIPSKTKTGDIEETFEIER